VNGSQRPAGVDPCRVLVVEDDNLMRTLVTESLRARGHVVHGVADASAAVDWATGNVADVACLDVDLRSTLTGFDLASILRKLPTPPAIVFLSAIVRPSFFDPAVDPVLGGASYLLKSSVAGGDMLAEAVSSAAAGLVFVDSSLLTMSTPGTTQLSQQQVVILQKCASGRTNAAIAQELGVSTTTVETALSRAARKLGVESTPGTNARVACITAYLRYVGRA
jgi:DNA-binding NarL/FixJ family response regulator